MSNIIVHAEQELRTFSQLPFNEVDSLVLAQLSYIHFDGLIGSPEETREPVPLRDMLRAECYASMFDNVRAAGQNKQLLYALAASPRYRDMRLAWYANRRDTVEAKQFCGVTMLLPDGTAYIAFRGTDATMLGWKEDFDMAFTCPVPAQREGVSYIDRIAALTDRPLRVGGHSKGGNIAVYAAMQCAQPDRITAIYSHDGPGFRSEVLDSDRFRIIKNRIHKTLPQSSLIGMLLQTQECYSIVESDRFWIMQHDPFSWQVADGDFCYTDKLSGGAQYLNTTLNEWVNSISDDDRRLFVESLFTLVDATGAETFSDLVGNWAQNVPAVMRALRALPSETRKRLQQFVEALAKLALRNLVPDGAEEFSAAVTREVTRLFPAA